MKRFLAAALALLCLSGSAPRPGGARQAKTPLRIIVAADPHVLSPALTDGGPLFQSKVASGDGKDVLHSMELLDALLAQVTAQRPGALILCGDLTYQGERASHAALARRLREVREMGTAVLVLPGNHDLNNRYAGRYRGERFTPAANVTAGEFRALYASCGYGDALARDPDSLSYVYPLAEDLRVLMLDVNASPQPGAAGEATKRWAREQLTRAREDGATVLAVSHQTLLSHTGLYPAGRIADGEALARLYGECGVALNLSGHLHIQHIAREGALTDAATGSLAVYPHLYAAVGWDGAGAFTYEARPLGGVGEGGGEASRALFERTCRAKVLGELDGRAPSEREAMAQFAVAVNLDYFAGTFDPAAYRENPARLLWREQDSFWGGYLESLLHEPAADQRRAVVSLSGG